MARMLIFAALLVLGLATAASAQVTSPSCLADQQPNVVYYNTGTIPPGSPIEANVVALSDFLISTTSTMSPSSGGVRTGQGTRGGGSNTVYGYAQCYNLSSSDCDSCLAEARNRIQNEAPRTVGARLCTARCSIRFELYPFV